ncbi:efflux RND transporter periplasmic adaptor subunit [Brasilonema sp. UFV-L1]|uniref:efflux RND transporter periplasmic adaptor subunit n=1 Tax=Brasilonema sp. UFV-L1 TaxID=2234130 RepID=UPI00145C7AB2|nr:efflux RND transporter periplasmic adaptor subunit [Brasilonema sp. UFV-L1]NMG05368.1 efflux transporter periplasmic adaptor subunit [Brasilonema sp. UFV-L1]
MIWHKDKKKFKTGVQWLAMPAALAAVGLGGWLTYFLVLNRPPEPVAVRLLTVERGNVEITITEGGTVELREQRIVKSPTEGAVDRVLVKPGEKVTSGQVLLTLRYPERKIALAKHELQIREQEFTLARDREKIVEAQQQLTAEEGELQKYSSLATVGAVAQQQVKRQEDTVRTVRARLRDSQAQARITGVKLQSLQLERQGIEQQLQNTIVSAPFNSVVLGIYVKDGDGVQFRTNLLTLGDPNQVLVKLQLSTLNAARVRVNQIARVSAIGPSVQTFTGYVQSLYPQALTPEETQKEGGNQNQSTQATVPATVLLNTPTSKLIPNSRVNVEIVLEQRQNVVVLSTEAIQRSGPHPFVWVRDSQNKAQKRTINLGLEGLVTTEVTSGLHAGEQIIVPPPQSQLKSGMPVTPEGGIQNGLRPAQRSK